MLRTRDFSDEEFAEVLKRAKSLLEHGYFTGVNFIQSRRKLPDEAIIIHFLQDSKKHINFIKRRIKHQSLTTSRYTFYSLREEYFDKPTFDTEYAHAIFFDRHFHQISLEVAKTKRKDISVANKEFDLLIPVEASKLERIVDALDEQNVAGPEPFLDPVIIVRTERKLPTLPQFINSRPYANIRRNSEEFYTVLQNKMHANALRRYVRKVCRENPQIGKLDQNSLVFDLSQVNREFLEYMSKTIKPLEPLV